LGNEAVDLAGRRSVAALLLDHQIADLLSQPVCLAPQLDVLDLLLHLSRALLGLGHRLLRHRLGLVQQAHAASLPIRWASTQSRRGLHRAGRGLAVDWLALPSLDRYA